MHIALLIPGLDRIGGAEGQVLLLARGMRRRGWRVSVVVLSGDGGQAAAKLQAAQIDFVSLGFRRGLADPRGWRRFREWLRSEQPDLLHAHLPHAAWLARAARLWGSAPALVDTLHSSATGGWVRHLLYRLSRGLPDGVTAVSYAAAETHLLAHMVRAETLHVIPNGIDFHRFRLDRSARQALRAGLGAEDSFLWLAVGRLDRVKDYPTLLRAVSGLPADVSLWIAGAGPEEKALKALALWLGLGSRVRFFGFRADVDQLMQAADGFVLSSRWEGMPVALLEAAGCELPIVATDVQGTREAVECLGAGRLVAPGDPAALASGMRDTMQRPAAQLRAMAAHARRNAELRFALDVVLDEWESIYRSLSTGQRPRGRPAAVSAGGGRESVAEPSLHESAR